MAQHFITRAILDTVRGLRGYPRLRVLDLSCGRGEILAELQRGGCEVRGTHFREDDYEIKSGRESFLTEAIPVDEGVDLTRPLPYPDGSFDVVILSVLFQSGLRVRKLRFTRFKPEHAWLLLFYPLIWLATRLETGSDEGERDLRRWMLHPAMLASEQLLLVAVK
jgi:SAM-dependent methyltransferase